MKKNILFQNILQEDLEKMLSCFSAYRKEYEKEQYIWHYGDIINEIGIILKGGVNIIKEDFWGNRAIIAKLTEGDVFGEAFAFSGKKEIDVSVVAYDNTEIQFLNCKKIFFSCNNGCGFHRTFTENMIKMISEKNIMLTRKMEHIMKKTTREKVLSYLSEIAMKNNSNTFTINLNRQEMADYLSVDRSALSNELSKLRKEGILDFNKNMFKLKYNDN